MARIANWLQLLLCCVLLLLRSWDDGSLWMLILSVGHFVVFHLQSRDESNSFWPILWKSLALPLAIFSWSLIIVNFLAWILSLRILDNRTQGLIFGVEQSLLWLRNTLGEVKNLGTPVQKVILFLLLLMWQLIWRIQAKAKALELSDQQQQAGKTVSPAERTWNTLKKSVKGLTILCYVLAVICNFTLFAFPLASQVAGEKIKQTRWETRIVQRENEKAQIQSEILDALCSELNTTIAEEKSKALVDRLSASSQFTEDEPDAYLDFTYRTTPRPPNPDDSDYPSAQNPPLFPQDRTPADKARWVANWNISSSLKNLGWEFKSIVDLDLPNEVVLDTRLSVQKSAQATLKATRAQSNIIALKVAKKDTMLTSMISDLISDATPSVKGSNQYIRTVIDKLKDALIDYGVGEMDSKRPIKIAKDLFAKWENGLVRSEGLKRLENELLKGNLSKAKTIHGNLLQFDEEFVRMSKRFQNMSSAMELFDEFDGKLVNADFSSVEEDIRLIQEKLPKLNRNRLRAQAGKHLAKAIQATDFSAESSASLREFFINAYEDHPYCRTIGEYEEVPSGWTEVSYRFIVKDGKFKLENDRLLVAPNPNNKILKSAGAEGRRWRCPICGGPPCS